MLLPAAPQDGLPAGHRAQCINDTADSLDLSAFCARLEGGGSRNQPFHPAMLVKGLVKLGTVAIDGTKDKAKENFTDPDSRIMKRTGGGLDPAYNAQTAVDRAAHIIVAAELDNIAPDANWLLPMIQAVKGLAFCRAGSSRVRPARQPRRQRRGRTPRDAPG